MTSPSPVSAEKGCERLGLSHPFTVPSPPCGEMKQFGRGFQEIECSDNITMMPRRRREGGMNERMLCWSIDGLSLHSMFFLGGIVRKRPFRRTFWFAPSIRPSNQPRQDEKEKDPRAEENLIHESINELIYCDNQGIKKKKKAAKGMVRNIFSTIHCHEPDDSCPTKAHEYIHFFFWRGQT